MVVVVLQTIPRPGKVPSPSMVDIEHECQQEPPRPQIPSAISPNVIEDDDMVNMMTNSNLYCFAAFADKHTGTILMTSPVHSHSLLENESARLSPLVQ